MVTKTLTITESAYVILASFKRENESFSQEITRLLARPTRRKLVDFCGILSKEQGTQMLTDLQRIKEEQREILAKRLSP